MRVDVINQYRKLVEADKADKSPINCRYCDMLLVPFIIAGGLVLKCPLCIYEKNLGYGEYVDLQLIVGNQGL